MQTFLFAYLLFNIVPCENVRCSTVFSLKIFHYEKFAVEIDYGKNVLSKRTKIEFSEKLNGFHRKKLEILKSR